MSMIVSSTCRLCGDPITNPPIGMILDERGKAALIHKFSSDLVRHLKTKHPETDKQLETAAIGYLGLIRTAQFKITEPTCAELVENTGLEVIQSLCTLFGWQTEKTVTGPPSAIDVEAVQKGRSPNDE